MALCPSIDSQNRRQNLPDSWGFLGDPSSFARGMPVGPGAVPWLAAIGLGLLIGGLYTASHNQRRTGPMGSFPIGDFTAEEWAQIAERRKIELELASLRLEEQRLALQGRLAPAIFGERREVLLEALRLLGPVDGLGPVAGPNREMTLLSQVPGGRSLQRLGDPLVEETILISWNVDDHNRGLTEGEILANVFNNNWSTAKEMRPEALLQLLDQIAEGELEEGGDDYILAQDLMRAVIVTGTIAESVNVPPQTDRDRDTLKFSPVLEGRREEAVAQLQKLQQDPNYGAVRKLFGWVR